MKKTLLPLLLFFCFHANSQQNSAYNINLLSVIAPDTNAPQSGNIYSGCWGWYQAAKNKEYIISGGRDGTWFIDVTNPSTPSVCAYVPGVSKGCTWRELKTYQNYCYIASDVCTPNAFQIVDMQYLPDSVELIRSDTSLFVLGHTLWVDKNKLYVGSTNFQNNKGFSPMSVWSLDDPANPALYGRLEKNDNVVNEIHDMYVRNDTIYASAGWQGLRIYRLESDSSFNYLGSYTNYHAGAYNHSSYLTQDGKHLVFCDEVPQSLPVKLIDVENFSNIKPVSSWHPEKNTTPHNPYVIGNKWAIISSYADGIFIYDIEDPDDVKLAGYFDTHPQAGHNTGNYGDNAYAGNWGAYPFLPSGIIAAQDMQNGVFLLDPTAAYNVVNPVSVGEVTGENGMRAFPNPAHETLHITTRGNLPATLKICDILGQEIVSLRFTESTVVETASLPPGHYILVVENEHGRSSRKIFISH